MTATLNQRSEERTRAMIILDNGQRPYHDIPENNLAESQYSIWKDERLLHTALVAHHGELSAIAYVLRS